MDKYEPHIKGYIRKIKYCKMLFSSVITKEDEQYTAKIPMVSMDDDTQSPEKERVKKGEQKKVKEVVNQKVQMKKLCH